MCGSGTPPPTLWGWQESVQGLEAVRLAAVEEARKARVRRRQEVKARLKRGGVEVDTESDDDDAKMPVGDDGRETMDFEIVCHSRSAVLWRSTLHALPKSGVGSCSGVVACMSMAGV